MSDRGSSPLRPSTARWQHPPLQPKLELSRLLDTCPNIPRAQASKQYRAGPVVAPLRRRALLVRDSSFEVPRWTTLESIRPTGFVGTWAMLRIACEFHRVKLNRFLPPERRRSTGHRWPRAFSTPDQDGNSTRALSCLRILHCRTLEPTASLLVANSKKLESSLKNKRGRHRCPHTQYPREGF